MSELSHQQRLLQAQTKWSHMFALAKESNHTSTDRPDTFITLSTDNMQTNFHWGDQIKHQKSDEVTRIYSQNVNGFKLDKEGGQYSIFCKIHQEIQSDVSCCQEINLDTTQYNVKAIMHKIIQRHWKRSRLTMGSTPIAFSG